MAANPHTLSNLVLGQAGGSEFGVIGNTRINDLKANYSP
jgi:hypothetical protein